MANTGATFTGNTFNNIKKDLDDNGPSSFITGFYKNQSEKEASDPSVSADDLIKRRGYQYQILGHLRKLKDGDETSVEYLQFLTGILTKDKGKSKFLSVVVRSGADTGAKADKDDQPPRKQIYDLFKDLGLQHKGDIAEDIGRITDALKKRTQNRSLRQMDILKKIVPDRS